MKKQFLSLALASLLVGSLSALTLDKDSAKVNYQGFKTPAKVAAAGTFKDVVFTFSSTDGDLKTILTNSKAEVDFNKIDTIKNPIRDNNIRTKLVAHMKTPNIVVSFKSVEGDDTAGNIVAEVNMNEVVKEVPMKYEVKDGLLKASGTIKMTDYMPEAYDKFKNDKVIAGLHAKVTWDEVDIFFEANVK